MGMKYFASGNTWSLKADQSYNDSKTLQDCMRCVKQQSHGCKTYA